MLLSEILATLVRDHAGWTGTVPDDWSQGRSIFGGLQAALVLRAMRALVPGHLPLRVMQTTFVAPVLTGTVHVRARVLRAGKNAIDVLFIAGDEALNRSDDFLYTLFVPARAHLTFPCFDQPNLKARFKLILSVPANWRAGAISAAWR